jgi:hypothetical protein
MAMQTAPRTGYDDAHADRTPSHRGVHSCYRNPLLGILPAVLSRNVARGPRNGLDGPSSRLLLVLGSAPWAVSLCHDLHISVFCPLDVKGPWGLHSGTCGRFTWGNRSQVNDVDRGWRMACYGYARDASDVQQVLFGIDDRLRRMQWMSPNRTRQSTLPSREHAFYCDSLVLEISHPSTPYFS